MHMHLGAKIAAEMDPSGIIDALPGEAPASAGWRMGSRSTTGSTRTANRYDNTSSCPPGQQVVQHGSTYHAAAYIGGPTSTPHVYCRPIPAPAPAAPPPPPVTNITTTVSPVLQTDISPQISPIFQQTQDSPGAVQSGAPTQYRPGGQTATGGGSGADSSGMLEFMRMQAEMDERRRAEETARRETERREAAAREAQYREREFAFQTEQARTAQERQVQIDAQAAADRQRREEIDAANQAAYREALEKSQSQATVTPAQTIVTGGPPIPVMPSQRPTPATVPVDEGPNMPLIIGGLIVAAGAGYFLLRKKR